MKARRVMLVLVWSSALAGCEGKRPAAAPPPAVRVEEVVVSGNGHGGASTYSAVVQPASQVPLAFRGPGYVAELMRVRSPDGRTTRALGEGDHVHAGAVVARLRDAEYRDKLGQAGGHLAQARAAAEKARLDFERATRLSATQSITRPELEAATAQRDATRAQVAAAEAALEEAQVAVRDTALVSPIEGDVIKKSVEPGSFVGPGMPAFVVADVSRVKILVGLPDIALRSVQLNQPVVVSSDALPGRKFTALISRIASAADAATRNFDVEVEIPNPERQWRAGMIASVELGTPGAQVVSPRLPLSAFVEAGGADRFAVMVVEGQGDTARARLRSVELGELSGNRVAVTKGLAAGERIITTGASIVADGEHVEIIPPEAP